MPTVNYLEIRRAQTAHSYLLAKGRLKLVIEVTTSRAGDSSTTIN